MRELFENEVVILLQTLYADPIFLKKHCNAVEETGLLDDNKAAHLVYAGIKAYYEQFGKAPDLRLLVEDVKAAVLHNKDRILLADMKRLWPQFVKDIKPVPEYCKKLILEATKEGSKDMVMQILPNLNLFDKEDRELVRDMMNKMLSEESEDDFSSRIVAPYGQAYMKMAGEGTKRPYNIGWLDELTGGGGADGDSLLMVIPSGGGKTTLALEMAFRCGEDGRHTTMLFTEQSPAADPDISLRQDVLGSGAPRKTWEKIRAVVRDTPVDDREAMYHQAIQDNLASGQYTLWYDNQNIWRNNVLMLDCVENPILDLEAFLAELEDAWTSNGITPYLVILDWLGPLAESTASSRFVRSDADHRRHIQWVVQTLVVFAQKWKIRFVCFHQAAGAVVKANTKGAPIASSFRAAESTTLPYRFTYAMAASTQFGDQNFWMVADKMRSYKQGRRRLKLDGEYCRVKPVAEETVSVNRL